MDSRLRGNDREVKILGISYCDTASKSGMTTLGLFTGSSSLNNFFQQRYQKK
jgi:hypothetical protein